MISNSSAIPDLAGPVPENPSWHAIKQRVDALGNGYCNRTVLDSLIADLPAQLLRPTVRPWGAIAWETIHRGQILGIAPETFLAILAGAAATEAPIRGYSKASRQYLERVNPAIARLVGGTVTANGLLVEPGLWEKEERRHAPSLRRLYRQLGGTAEPIWADGDRPNPTGPKTPIVKRARPYDPGADPRRDLFRHGLHRIATEYGAACLYLWLAAQTTGALQQVCVEILQDELNHLTKFWCFGRWLYARPMLDLARALWHNAGRGSHTFRYMQTMLAWSRWTSGNQVELAYTFARTFLQISHWSAGLQSDRLNRLLAPAASENVARSSVLRSAYASPCPQTKR